MHTPIVNEAQYPIRPEDIDLSRSLAGAFGGSYPRKERAAHLIMSFLVDRGGGWKPFSDADIQTYFHRTKPKSRRFSYRRSLWSGGLINIDPKTGMIAVSHEFVALCFLMSPNLIGEAPQERKSST